MNKQERKETWKEWKKFLERRYRAPASRVLLYEWTSMRQRYVSILQKRKKKKNEGERKRSIERLWVEKCPAGREGAFNTISCHLHLENVPTGRSKGVLSLGSLRCRLLSELPIHGSHWRNDFPSRHCSHFVSFHWSPLLRRCSSSTRLRGDDQW